MLPAEPPSASLTPGASWWRCLPWPELLLVLLLITTAFMSRLSPAFLSVRNLAELFRFSTEIGLVSLGMTLVILTAGIDSWSARRWDCVRFCWALAFRWGLISGWRWP